MTLDLCGLINPDVFKAPRSRQRTGTFVHRIEEKQDSGKMNLSVAVTDQCLRYANLEAKNFGFLQNRCCADGMLWESLGNKRYRLHLFEMKLTIKTESWEKAKKQYHGSFLRCLMIADLLGLNIDPCIHLYTVYHNDGFSSVEPNNTDIVWERIPTDEPPDRQEREWSNDRCDLDWLAHRGPLCFRHHKIHLPDLNADGIPEGEYSL